ncbi:MAG: ATP-binding protein, partial [Chitinophagaceae bacterium]
ISEYIRDIEGSSITARWCKSYDQALEELCSNKNHLYFVDYRLGNQTGLDFLKEAEIKNCAVPIVLLTGKGNKSIDIEAMQFGATDYLIKSELNTEKLERCIRYSLDRAAALQSLKESENKYRTLFEGSKDAVFITDHNLSFTEVNTAAATLFDMVTGELLNSNLFNFIADEQSREEIKSLVENNENITDYEVEIVSNSKNIRHCLLSVTLPQDNKNAVFVHGILHDITNIKKVEKANIIVQKQAANERLVQILAHEIRNPLNNIRLSVDHMKLAEGDEKNQNLVSIIQRNCTRINAIITELLDSTRPGELIFEKHSLQEVMEESLANAADRINLQKVKVSKSFPEQPLPILADKSKLKIAFSNILINAIEAMEKDRGYLQVSVTITKDGYTVSIQDNGKGIPQEYLTKLFEPFFTLKKNGMGLGLAASYSIIQSHNATMQVKSTMNIGTNFIISFNI